MLSFFKYEETRHCYIVETKKGCMNERQSFSSTQFDFKHRGIAGNQKSALKIGVFLY